MKGLLWGGYCLVAYGILGEISELYKLAHKLFNHKFIHTGVGPRSAWINSLCMETWLSLLHSQCWDRNRPRQAL